MRSSLQDVRKIIYDLRPMSLDDLGLIPTVERLVTQYNETSDTFVEFKFLGKSKTLPIVEVAVFRVIQEALNNIKKHSQATNALIKIEFIDNSINLVIRDNGIGFSKDSLKS